MSHSKYIEIIGLPGSGKTTVAELLVKRLKENNVDSSQRSPLNTSIFNKIKIVLKVLILLIRTPSLFRFWFCSISSEYKNIPSVRSVVRNIKLRFLTEIIIVQQILSKNKQVFVNDEGLIGRLVVLLLLTSFKEELISKTLSKVLQPNTLIVYIDTPIDIAIDRTFDRNTFLPFFHEMDSGFRKNFYKLNQEVYNRLTADLKDNVISIRNTGIREELEREVETVIKTIFQQ